MEWWVSPAKPFPASRPNSIDLDPERFYLPAYMARHGWIGVRLDIEPVDWGQVEQLLTEAYTATAPKRILRTFQPTGAKR